MSKIMRNGKKYGGTASSFSKDIIYDNTYSGLESIDAQSAIDEVYMSVLNRPVNNNLLINSNFANPVNQRGETTKSDGGYWIDRWKKGTNITCSIGSGYIEISNNSDTTSSASFIQLVEESLLGKTLTFSAKVHGDSVYSITVDIPIEGNTTGSAVSIGATEYFDNQFRLYVAIDANNHVYVAIVPYMNQTIKVEWAKLELGEYATPYVPRLYAEELQLCKRYYQSFYSLLPPLLTSNYTSGGVLMVREMFPVSMRTNPTIASSTVFNHQSVAVTTISDVSLNYEVIAYVRIPTNLTAGVYFMQVFLDAEL